MGSSLIMALDFLVQTLFGLYLSLGIVRLVLPWVYKDSYHPLWQFVAGITDPIVMPLRRIFPYKNNIDYATLVCLIMVCGVKLILLTLLKYGEFPFIAGLLIWVAGDLIDLTLKLLMLSIILLIIVSWVNPGSYHPMIVLLHHVTEPFLRPIRRMIPPIAGFDISPIPLLIGIRLCSILIVNPIIELGFRWSLL